MVKTMKGYKALGKDMKTICGNSMGYRLNKWYKMRSNIGIKHCKRGYHFFNNIRDIVVLFYEKEYDIYEIEAKGDIIQEYNSDYNGKFVCSEIKIVRKLTEKEINRYIKDNLDKLINDKDWVVRREFARQRYGLEIFVNDEDWMVRREVARQGYGLDKLINDEYWVIRREVARQRYGLEILINDEVPYVRREVAKQGYGLNILINDEDPYVRREVAKQGYGLNILINDEDPYVRREVAITIKTKK